MFHIKVLLSCILAKESIIYRTEAKISFVPFSGKKSHFWHNYGAVATITQPTQNVLSRNIARFISDNNLR